MEVTMPVAMNAFFAANAITTKAALQSMGGPKRLFEYVKANAPTHWASLKTPEASVRWAYQRALEGYALYKAPPHSTAVVIAEPRDGVAEADSFLAEMEALLSSPAPVFTAARVDEKVSAKAAAAAKAAEKAAAKAAKAAEKEAAKEAIKAAKAAAWAAKAVAKAEEKAAAKAAAKAAPVDTEPVDGELKLLEGTLYMVKNDNVYEYDELTEKAGDFVGRLTAEETIDTDEEEVSVTVDAPASSAVTDTPPGTVVATLAPPAAATAPVALAPVALAKATASDVKRAATKEAKAVILRAQIARLEEQLARRQAELAALSG